MTTSFYILWVLIPWPVKLAGWCLIGISLAYAAYRLSPVRRWMAATAVLSLYIIVSGWIYVGDEYGRARERWLAEQCRATLSALGERPTRQLSTDGLLIAADLDRLINERFQRAAATIADKESVGGSVTVDTGRYEPHPVMRAMAKGSFNAMAMKLLTENRFSFVEFEMLPQGEKEYSNAGHLNTSNWSGKRYRHYYLAPGNHAECVNESGDVVSPSMRATISNTPFGSIPVPMKPYCLAMEITSVSSAQVRLNADEAMKMSLGVVRARGIWLPVSAYVRRERMRLSKVESGKPIGEYEGFNYPNDVERRHACNDAGAATNFIAAHLAPDEQRAFLRAKPWYEPSTVQALYEPEKARAAMQRRPPEAEKPGGDECPLFRRVRGDRIVVDQLNDFSGPTSAVNTTISDQRASFFQLERDAAISAVEWTGRVSPAEAKEKFLVRIFRDAEGLPGTEVYEIEGVPSVSVLGRFKSLSNTEPYLFKMLTPKLALPAGEYWLQISPEIPSHRTLYWANEPGNRSASCGSGNALRISHSKWIGPNLGIPARKTPGFSFRLMSEPDARARR